MAVSLQKMLVGGGDVYAQVRWGLNESIRNLKAELERMMANQRRISFA